MRFSAYQGGMRPEFGDLRVSLDEMRITMY